LSADISSEQVNIIFNFVGFQQFTHFSSSLSKMDLHQICHSGIGVVDVITCDNFFGDMGVEICPLLLTSPVAVNTGSTQPCVHPGSLNRVPSSLV